MMDSKMLDQVRHIGRQAALAAGALIKLNYEKPHDITLKGAIDPVTESDFASQETIINLIHQTFPDHGILAEEEDLEQGRDQGPASQETTSPSHRWIIDPLDGTVNFAHGFPLFCVSIGFEADGVVEYGVVFDPLREELFEANRGGGALVNGRPLKVSRVEKLERGLLATGFPYDIRERLPETLARMGRAMATAQGLRRAGSAALDLCYVAAGRLDGFFEENLKPWDTAAGMLLVLEAGGQLSTFDGGPYDVYAPNILASNGLLHRDLLGLLAGK